VKLPVRTLPIISVLIFSVLIFALFLIIIGNYAALPTHFDVIIVLGTPAKTDGTPSAEHRGRVPAGRP
jgi:hypothetical protein